jgi:Dolichyl-phosphate-mannose-protein mannosyltransferase
MVARRAPGISRHGIVRRALTHLIAPSIRSQLRRAAIAVSIASAVLLVASIANRLTPAGSLALRHVAGATEWTGWMVGAPEGTYTFTVPGGAAARLAIDGRVVADGVSTTPIHLDPAPHAFDLEDRRQPVPSGGATIADLPQVDWSRDGSSASPLPKSLLFARKPRPFTIATVSALRLFEAFSQWIWVAALVVSAAALARAMWRSVRPSVVGDVDWPRLRWILGASVALNAIPIWWGLPAIWPPDELSPAILLNALGLHFSHGWFDRWPPLHYYVLTVAISPVLLLNAFGRIDYSTGAWPQVVILLERSVSVAAAAGTVLAMALVASRVFGRRAGLFAAAIFALALPFPYYAKTANLDVPYLFWFAVSLVFYFRFLESPGVREAMAFATFATLAICTKDQAYALYPLMAVAIAFRAWQARCFRALAAGVGTAAVVFAACHNLLFNWDGFVEHVRFIIGPGSENYQVFPPTLAGRFDLARLTAALIKDSWGWPVTIVCAAGVAHALLIRRCLPALALAAPVVSYYFGFVNVILYDYDRFVLPITLVLAMFGGYAVDRYLAPGARARSWRAVGLALVFAYTILYAATLDALMLRDSRYVVGRWASERLKPGDTVAISGPRELEPGFTVPYVDVATREDLDRLKPPYYVLSADYARAAPSGTYWGRLISDLQTGKAGYSLIARVRCPSPWGWLPDAHPELVGPRQIEAGGNAVSVLRDVNPTLEVYARGPHARDNLACATTPH